MSRLSTLSQANLILFAVLLLHTIDHGAGQAGRDLPGSTNLVGAGGFAFTAASAYLALRRSPLSPEVSATVGVLTSVGVVAIHLMPNWWTWVSDPYWDFNAGFLSWLSVFAVLAAAMYLTYVGLRYQRYRHVKPYYRH